MAITLPSSRQRALPVALTRAVIRIMGWIAGAGTVVLMIPTVIDVTHRKLVGPSVAGLLEYSELGLVIVVYLGLAAAMVDHAHIYTPVVTSRLSKRVADRVRLGGQVLVWLLIALMVVGTAREAADSIAIGEYRFGIVQIPIWPGKVFIVLGLIALLAELTIQLYDIFVRVLRSGCGSS